MNFRMILCWVLTVVLVGCAGTGSERSEDFDMTKSSPADVYVQLGIKYIEKGNLDVALRNLQRALELDSRNSQAHNAIAVLYERLDEPETALTHYKRAVSLRRANASAHNNYGRLLCSLGHYEEAEEQFKIAYNTRLYKRPWIALTNAGRCARQGGDLEAADRYLRQALEKKPEFSLALLELAHVKFDSNNHFLVRAFLQRYQSAAVHTSESLWIGIQSEHALGDSKAVSQYVRMLREEFPASEEVGLLEKKFPQY